VEEVELPTFKEVIGPAYRTIFRRNKMHEDIHLEQRFLPLKINLDELSRFRDFFKYKEEVPMSYLYIFAQRGQVHLMLKKEFKLAIPGMIHIENIIQQFKEVNPMNPLTLDVVADVEMREGSLRPQFSVNFYQEDEKVGQCESTYLVRRKSKGTNTPRELPAKIRSNQKILWSIHENIGKLYGEIAGDKNPIHTSNLFAKIAGFKRSIVQGWYLVSRATNEIQNQIGKPINSLHVNFIKPVYVNSDIYFKFNESEFRLKDNGTILVAGKYTT